ncbi:nuclear factor NF-kappa-B p110 subunit isoform X2 [Diabrotica virgifera virgifera]|uniref:RHD domain-containing protein n=1 Tax=Diabrotica virgifera virgifera TaxID=50390 RepID=A0ABM5KK06_DIAVI|nr:nuclear factor NF-kappa-B p110 subunit isoform X2 [Diabrotica virgifera virgifera]
MSSVKNFIKNMSYPNMLTPPSSSEDSPHSTYLVASPSSNTFEYDNYEYAPVQPIIYPKPTVIVDPNLLTVKMEGPTTPSATLHFVEQPTDRFRFRYKSEMAGTHGSLTGINSDKSRKPTYPTVELRNCGNHDKVVIRCSIYQANANPKGFYPHAHRLMMKRGREEFDDPHDVEVGHEDGFRAVFQGMGIIHTAKRNLVTELVRKKVQLQEEHVARTENRRGLTQKEVVEIKGLAESESKSINLNIVCLRFDAYIKKNGILFPLCEPIFSHSINNLKSALTGDLKIVRLDHVVSPAKGNKEVFILVERVTKKNIKIRFYELDDDENVVWEGWGQFNDLDVHHQYAIVFKTPKYRDENITSPVNVFVELVRPSDQARSEAREFRYVPNKNMAKPGQKRARYDYYSSSSYDSSNVGSEELPAVINTLQIGQDSHMSFNNIPSGLSDEIKRALTDMNSDEFQQLHDAHADEYLTLLENLATDGVNANSMPVRKQRRDIQIQEPIKMEVSNEDKRMAIMVVSELRSFIRTTHTAANAITILNKYFNADNCTNALHVCAALRDNDSAMLLLKVIAVYRVFHLLDKTNDQNLTALHIAVMCHNKDLTKALVLCNSKLSVTDSNLNTVLHIAIKSNVPIEIFETLLRPSRYTSVDQVKGFIDMVNLDGNTALMMAVEANKLAYVKLLCFKNADVNKKQPKNGFVPLRIAIEKQHTDIIRYLLSLEQTDPTIKDFTNISPLVAGIMKTENEEIRRIIENYMKSNNIVLDIKEEPEETDDEMDVEFQDVEVKTEKREFSPEELEELYEGIHSLTPQCLDTVSSILDIHDNWKNLAQLLEMEHLVDSGMIKSEAKAILTHAIEANHDWTNPTCIFALRNFLENLDEIEAVEVMDKMVFELKNKT